MKTLLGLSRTKKLLVIFVVVVLGITSYLLYQSRQPDYSLKYPKGWKVTEQPKPKGVNDRLEVTKVQSQDFTAKTNEEGGKFTVRGAEFLVVVRPLPPNEKDSTIDQLIDGPHLYKSQLKATTLGGLKAVEYIETDSEPPAMYTVAYKDGLQYQIVYQDAGSPDFGKHLPDYRQFVQSFKFK